MEASGPPHHICSRGAHGVIDEEWNLLALGVLCNYDGSGAHAVGGGNEALVERFPHLEKKIREAGEKVCIFTSK